MRSLFLQFFSLFALVALGSSVSLMASPTKGGGMHGGGYHPAPVHTGPVTYHPIPYHPMPGHPITKPMPKPVYHPPFKPHYPPYHYPHYPHYPGYPAPIYYPVPCPPAPEFPVMPEPVTPTPEQPEQGEEKAPTIMTLTCTVIDARAIREIAGLNMNVMPASEEELSVAGIALFADKAQKQFQTKASGTFTSEEINLQLGDLGDINLKPVSQNEGKPVFQGSVRIFGKTDDNNLRCKVAPLQE